MGRKKGKGKSQDDKWYVCFSREAAGSWLAMDGCGHMMCRDDGEERGLDDVSTAEVVGENPVRGAAGGQKKGKKKKTFGDM